MGQVLPLARIAGRGWRTDLTQAPLPGVRIGQAPEAVDAEFHRRGGEGGAQRQEQQGKGRGMIRPGTAPAVPHGTGGHGRLRPRNVAATTALVFALLGAAAPAHGATVDAAPSGAPVVLMPIEELRPGMQGTARTVFEGNNLEEFKVEILGTLKSAIGPQQDLIIARLSGDKVEYTGVVSGMSGSPVYINGKLVGAVSYRLGTFAKEAIAGITPIADMIKLVAPARAPEGLTRAPALAARFLASRAGAEGPIAGAGGGAQGAAPEGPSIAAASGPASGPTPIRVTLGCSGCDPGVLRYYAPIFESCGLEP